MYQVNDNPRYGKRQNGSYRNLNTQRHIDRTHQINRRADKEIVNHIYTKTAYCQVRQQFLDDIRAEADILGNHKTGNCHHNDIQRTIGKE